MQPVSPTGILTGSFLSPSARRRHVAAILTANFAALADLLAK